MLHQLIFQVLFAAGDNRLWMILTFVSRDAPSLGIGLTLQIRRLRHATARYWRLFHRLHVLELGHFVFHPSLDRLLPQLQQLLSFQGQLANLYFLKLAIVSYKDFLP